jgi:hypothetical protein
MVTPRSHGHSGLEPWYGLSYVDKNYLQYINRTYIDWSNGHISLEASAQSPVAKEDLC